MKSIEEIDRRLKEIEDAPNTYEKSIQRSYLELAKEYYETSHWLYHLLHKYQYEEKDAKAIVETLKWVLEEDE